MCVYESLYQLWVVWPAVLHLNVILQAAPGCDLVLCGVKTSTRLPHVSFQRSRFQRVVSIRSALDEEPEVTEATEPTKASEVTEVDGYNIDDAGALESELVGLTLKV